jgi:hypothetical protein
VAIFSTNYIVTHLFRLFVFYLSNIPLYTAFYFFTFGGAFTQLFDCTTFMKTPNLSLTRVAVTNGDVEWHVTDIRPNILRGHHSSNRIDTYLGGLGLPLPLHPFRPLQDEIPQRGASRQVTQ